VTRRPGPRRGLKWAEVKASYRARVKLARHGDVDTLGHAVVAAVAANA
jgi:hypothetical protein